MLKFNVVIKIRNKEHLVRDNLLSLAYQNYQNFKIFYFDDNSDDNTFEKVNEISENLNWFSQDKMVLNKNDKRMYGAYATYMGIKASVFDNPNGITIFLDGDDILLCNSVFKILKKIYENHLNMVGMVNRKVLYNLGNKTDEGYETNFKNSAVCAIRSYSPNNVRKINKIKGPIPISPLRSFRNSHLAFIKEDHYKRLDGSWTCFCDDLQLVITMQEKCKKSQYIGTNPIFFYGYNIQATLNASESWFNYIDRKKKNKLSEADVERNKDYHHIYVDSLKIN